MSLRSRRILTATLAVPLVIGMHQWPALPAHAADWRPEVQQTESIKVVNADPRKAGAPKAESFTPAEVRWPSAEDTSVNLAGSSDKARRAGQSPITVGATSESHAKSARTARVQVLDRAASDALVGPGVVSVIETTPGTELSVALDYSGFAAAAGGDYAGRLRLVALPECALTTPELEECQEQTDLGSINDLGARQLTATITVPGASESTLDEPDPTEAAPGSDDPVESPAAKTPVETASPAEADPTAEAEPAPSPTAEEAEESIEHTPSTLEPEEAGKTAAPVAPAATGIVVLAAAATSASEQGDFGATSLKPSSSWTAGGSSGEFSWAYPLRVPTTQGGVVPSLELTYSSGGTDGGVSNTNNQASWVGEGFELGAAFIERKYQTCYDDRSSGNNSSSNALDLCWYTDKKKTNNEKWDNAFLSMDGHSGELVREPGTANWRLEKDDGTRIAKLGTVVSNNEYWRVTTPDGTQYFFGKGRSDGNATATNSTWKVPVAANHSGEPGYNSAFASSFTVRPWRWNLDYVVSPTGSTITYYYAKEANKYKKNLSTSTSYDRGGYLTRIEYGDRKGAEVYDQSPGKVAFTVEERCDTTISSTCKTATPTSSTAKAWPDVPMDAVCDTYCPSQKTTPTFFTRKRVSQIDTFTRNSGGTAYEEVDRWVLGASFPKPADGGAVPSLWLASITQSGRAGTAITLPALNLGPIMLDSRIKGSAGVALEKPRLAVITSETGAQTLVNYSAPECTSATVPTTAQIPTNTKRCMPVWYSSGTAAPTLQWFNKYVVTKVTDRDLTAYGDVNLTALGLDISADVVTNYTYTGGGAWRYNDSPMMKEKYRTWGEWRGYGKVTAAVGTGTTKSVTETLYFRGMHGDKLASGTKSVSIVDSEGVSRVDEDWFAGMVRETRTLIAVGGAEDSGSIMDQTAVAGPTDGRLTSRRIDVKQTDSRQKLAAGGYRRGRERTLDWDAYGQPTKTESLGDLAITGDETCTRTTYATPSDAAIGPIDRVATTTTMPNDCTVAENVNQFVSAAKHYYGTATPTGPISAPGLETKLEMLTGSGTTRVWKPMAQTVYDAYGRVTQATDPLGNVATSTFTATTGRLLSTMTVTTADPDGTGPAAKHVTTTTFDTRRGVATKRVDPGGQITEATYDALGRTTAVWRPGRSKASQTASETYSYAVSKTVPTAVTTQTLLPNGSSYRTTISLLDSYLRPRQEQTPGASAGRIVTDTRYDSRGNAVLVDRYYNASAPATTLIQPSNRADIPTSNRSHLDFAGRSVKEALYSAETFKWETLTSYGGDRVKTTPPAGGTPTTVVSDYQGRTTSLTQHLGTTPAATGVTTTYSYDKAGNLAGMVDAKGNAWHYTYDLAGNKLTSDDPDKGLSTMTYNVAGQLLSSTDARGVTLKYFYDNLGRPIKTTKADGTTLLTSTTYDTVKPGLVSSSSRYLAGGTVTNQVNSYDTAGRPTSSSTIVPAITGLIPTELAGTYTTTTSYNADGSTNTVGLPATGPVPAETLTLGYTATGLANTLTGSIAGTPATYVTSTQYLQYGTISAMVFGTHAGQASMATYTRDEATQRLASTQLNRQVAPGVTAEHTDLVYDPAGNITQALTYLAGGVWDNQCFGYDYQQQLTEAWTPTGNTCDPGTRSQASLSGPAPYWSSWATGTTGKTTSRTDRTATTSTITSYAYNADGGDHPHFVTGTTRSGSAPGATAYSVDAAGNTVGRPSPAGVTQTLVWDDANQLTEVREGTTVTARMAYDASGARLVRQQGNTTTVYLAGTELTVTGAAQTVQPPGLPNPPGSPVVSALRYYSHAGQTIAMRSGTSNDTVVTLIPDHQGTTHHQISNATSALRTVWQDPYGGKRGTPPTGWVGDRSFVGGTNDATGLIRIGARDYDPVLQRFVTVDPVQEIADPLQWNAYLYANNSPVTYSDPTGLTRRLMYASPDGSYNRAIPVTSSSGPSTKTNNDDGGKKTAQSGNNANNNPGGIKPAAQDPQRDFWANVAGFVAGAVVAVAVTVAVGALCASTAGLGCLILAGVASGAASSFVSYSTTAGILGTYDPGEALRATVEGGALGGVVGWATPVLGPAIKTALAPLGNAIKNAVGTALSGAKSVLAQSARPGATKGADSLLSNGASRAGKRLPMNMQTVCETACKYDIDISDVTIKINKGRAGYAGSTAPNGTITLTRSAFANEEQLARTLYHERFHVDQIRSGMGYPTSRAAAGPWEDAAVAAENTWWGSR